MATNTVFFCKECGYESAKWMGKCPGCNSWNSFVEEKVTKKNSSKTASGHNATFSNNSTVKKLKDIVVTKEIRLDTGYEELNRVFGGGIVEGSLNLIGGEPGIGKSTLIMQVCSKLSELGQVLYISGEESETQVKLRADRLGVNSDNILFYNETDIDTIESKIEELNPKFCIVDSIQTMYHAALDSTPGSVPQVKDCTMALMRLAKEQGVTVFIVSHVNKEGAIAGPKVLEHMVDCVLYFEGDSSMGYRILRAVKNRFGSTNEIGVFEMREEGLREVPNPSESLLSGRPVGAAGTCVACAMEGSRPVLAELQALVAKSSANVPRRSCSTGSPSY